MKYPVIRVLVGANIVLTAAVVLLVTTAFRRAPDTVLTVQRLNIVDSTGKPVLVLSKVKLLRGALMYGK